MALRTIANIKSGDFLLGVPFNFGFYALMTHMLAQLNDLKPGTLFHTFGDAHIYSNHVEQVDEQLSREIIEDGHGYLNLDTHDYQSIVQFKFEDINIEDYKHHAFIKAPVAV